MRFSVCVFAFFPHTITVAALQKQLLKLKYAVFVYYESDAGFQLSSSVPVNLRLHTECKGDTKKNNIMCLTQIRQQTPALATMDMTTST